LGLKPEAQDRNSAGVRVGAVLQHGHPLVGVTALVPGEGRVPLERLVLERTVSANTAAAGGNASLMTLG
jgi:RHH-type proline utilization regulon transcriptional repressor/proline dehydrogenase/delta 1-pyrroline-5-carboxylate dehydrogenase